MKITTIIIHHSAVSRTKNNNQFDAVKNFHINKGWGDIGYHYVIEPNGEIKVGRKEGEIGSHCIEQDMNFKSIGIMLTGDFDTERPTIEQLKALRELIDEIQIRQGNLDIHYHRDFATYKSCPGNKFLFKHTNLKTNNKPMENKYEAILKEVPLTERLFKDISGDDPLSEKEIKSLIEIGLNRLFKKLTKK